MFNCDYFKKMTFFALSIFGEGLQVSVQSCVSVIKG